MTMFSKSVCLSLVLCAVMMATPGEARMRWPERDGRPVLLAKRRFGQEHPAVIDKISQACPGQVCGVLSGQAITPLLAAQPECTQQQMADAIINASRQFDNATQTNMIQLAIEYRQVEKNTPPDFTTNPPTLRNSVFCQEAPQNSELNGLVQAQDPANNPNDFFDPALGKTVLKGSQANTFPFGTTSVSSASSATTKSAAVAAETNKAAASSACPAATATVTVTKAPPASTQVAVVSTATCPAPSVTVTVTRSASATASATTSAASSTSTSASTSSGTNLQTFSGALGGVTPPPVTALGGGNFQVTGNAQFNNLQNALVRSCDVQHNQCADKANATGNKGDLTVTACGDQQTQCDAHANSTVA